MSSETEGNFKGNLIFPSSVLEREKTRKIDINFISQGKLTLTQVESHIYKVLNDPVCGGDKGHKARVAIVHTMFDKGDFTEDEILRTIADNRKWGDYNEVTTREGVRSITQKGNGNGKGNERGGKTSEAKFSPPSLPLSNEIDELINKVKWRQPDVKPTVESINYYIINNFDVNSYQHMPDREHSKAYYVPIKHDDKNIWRHLETALNRNYNKPFTYGAYEKNREDKGKWLCFDLDEKDDSTGSNKANSYKIIGYFESRGISPMLENASEGIESYHVWVFCDPTDITTLRAIGEAALRVTGIKCELSPKCDPSRPLGNLVRVPYGLNRKRNLKSVRMGYDKGIACSLFKCLKGA